MVDRLEQFQVDPDKKTEIKGIHAIPKNLAAFVSGDAQ